MSKCPHCETETIKTGTHRKFSPSSSGSSSGSYGGGGGHRF